MYVEPMGEIIILAAAHLHALLHSVSLIVFTGLSQLLLTKIIAVLVSVSHRYY
jgi:hypothetical protein